MDRPILPGFHRRSASPGRLYRFASYTGARLASLTIGDQEVSWSIRDRRHELAIVATRASGSLLRAPSTFEMDRRIAESLNATVEVSLTEWRTRETVFAGRGSSVGLEVGGQVEALLDMARSEGSGETTREVRR